MGLFQCTRSPLRVSSAPAIFQREMENLLRGLPHVAVYFDDILITGANNADHCRNLLAVPGKLQDSGLKLKLEKCRFFMPRVEYLGHTFSKEGLSLNMDKVSAILPAPVPQDVKELQSFLGHINLYRKFSRTFLHFSIHCTCFLVMEIVAVGKGQARRFHDLQASGDFSSSSRTSLPGHACSPQL